MALKRMVLQIGMGTDIRGADYTKAAVRALRDALWHNSLSVAGALGLPVDAMQQNLQATIDRTRAKYPQVEILIAGMQMPPNLGAEYARDFQQAFVRLAQKNKATLIPFLLEGVGGRPELNLPDRIHPTVEGHKIVAENVWKYLRPVLQKLQP